MLFYIINASRVLCVLLTSIFLLLWSLLARFIEGSHFTGSEFVYECSTSVADLHPTGVRVDDPPFISDTVYIGTVYFLGKYHASIIMFH